MDIIQEQHRMVDTNNINILGDRSKNTKNRGIEKAFTSPKTELKKDIGIKKVNKTKERNIGFCLKAEELDDKYNVEDPMERFFTKYNSELLISIGITLNIASVLIKEINSIKDAITITLMNIFGIGAILSGSRKYIQKSRLPFLAPEYALKRDFGSELSFTYDNFLNQIKETSKIAKENDITYIPILAHGNPSKGNPSIWLGKTKIRWEKLLDELDKIKGVKVLLVFSCGSGKIAGVIKNRETASDYWLIASDTGHWSRWTASRQPWNMLKMSCNSLKEKFDKYRNYWTRHLFKKATYVEGRNIYF